MNQTRFNRIIIGVIALGLGRDVYLLTRPEDIPPASKQAGQAVAPARTGMDSPAIGPAAPPNFSALGAQNGPSVVDISVSGNGKVSRGRLGLVAQSVTQALADSFGLDQPAGVLVTAVHRDGSAAKAGIQPGDIILKLDGVDMTDLAQMGALVADLKPGSKATVTVWRHAKPKVIALAVRSCER